MRLHVPITEKQRQMAMETEAQDKRKKESKAFQSAQDAMAQLELLENQPLPSTPEAKEQFFIQQLKIAEDFMGRGNVRVWNDRASVL